MQTAPRSSWLGAVIVAGLAYALVGIAFSTLGGRAGSEHARVASRLIAWGISVAIYATHVWYECGRRDSRPRTAAWHVSLAAALGAFLLAVAANLHARAGSGYRLPLALIAFPLVIGVPAFVVAFVAAAALTQRRARSS